MTIRPSLEVLAALFSLENRSDGHVPRAAGGAVGRLCHRHHRRGESGALDSDTCTIIAASGPVESSQGIVERKSTMPILSHSERRS